MLPLCNTFDLHEAIIGLETSVWFCLSEVVLLRFYCSTQTCDLINMVFYEVYNHRHRSWPSEEETKKHCPCADQENFARGVQL